MNEFQAAMGLCNLEQIDYNIEQRKKLYQIYLERLAGHDFRFQKLISTTHNYGYMPILLKNREIRDRVFDALTYNGITPRKYFFPLVVDFDYFKKFHVNYAEKYGLVNAVNISDRVLCLPLYPDLEESIVEKIANITIKAACKM